MDQYFIEHLKSLIGVPFQVTFDPISKEECITEIRKAFRDEKPTTNGINFFKKIS